ncbi:MAG: NAD(P)H-binding protein [Verrucomicrobia bacterium]|jgi:nucleoside-diphosphate-sugar epimerase|nr:NAD(P)H-binding protein [Verrucomicrobiota bacterium]
MVSPESSAKPLVAIAGASGFVGTHLRRYFGSAYRFRALTRSANIAEQNPDRSNTEWRCCDLYSLPQVAESLAGCEYGIYLVHSMAPSSRLVQSNFEDTDLLLADNFIRAAEEAGLKHIIYLSGLIPQTDEPLSPHLRSRLEVENVLRSRSVRVTVLRAGLIFGPGGSSFSLLINLVRRLPLMLLPAWVRSKTHSVDILNVCQAFELCLEEPEYSGQTFDLGGHRPMTYKAMIQKTAELLGKPAHFINFPLNCFGLSKHWVSLFGSVPPALVGPLQESLQHDLEAVPNALTEALKDKWVSFEDSFQSSVDASGRPKPNPRDTTQSLDRQQIKQARRVRSVQRMPLPGNWDAQQIAEEYGVWLSRRFGGLIQAEQDDEGIVRFTLWGGRPVLLELTPTPYSLGSRRRCAFYITGGILSRQVDPMGRLEFRLFPEQGCLIASIHGFAPTLPWTLYALTQARLHLRVMRAFGRHLRRQYVAFFR